MCIFDLANLPDIKHPFTRYTLNDAVNLALNNAKVFGHEAPTTILDVRTYLNDMATRIGHNWLTGAAALDVLDAAIDGKDIRSGSRYLGPPDVDPVKSGDRRSGVPFKVGSRVVSFSSWATLVIDEVDLKNEMYICSNDTSNSIGVSFSGCQQVEPAPVSRKLKSASPGM